MPAVALNHEPVFSNIIANSLSRPFFTQISIKSILLIQYMYGIPMNARITYYDPLLK